MTRQMFSLCNYRPHQKYNMAVGDGVMPSNEGRGYSSQKTLSDVLHVMEECLELHDLSSVKYAYSAIKENECVHIPSSLKRESTLRR